MDNKTYTKNAKYAFTYTLGEEFNQSVNLDKDEDMVIKRIVRIKSFLYRPAYFALTTKRLIFLKHYLFIPDRVISIDLKHIKNIEIKKSEIWSLLTLFTRFKYISLDFNYKGKVESISFFYSSGLRSFNVKSWNITTNIIYSKIKKVLK